MSKTVTQFPVGYGQVKHYFDDSTGEATPVVATDVDPPVRYFAITPHDTNELPVLPRAIYVGGAGNVTLIGLEDNTAVTFYNAPSGFIIPGRIKIVKATGTTATNLVAMV